MTTNHVDVHAGGYGPPGGGPPGYGGPPGGGPPGYGGPPGGGPPGYGGPPGAPPGYGGPPPGGYGPPPGGFGGAPQFGPPGFGPGGFAPPPAAPGGPNEPLAIISLVLGLVSLPGGCCCSLLILPIAIGGGVTGIIALQKANANPYVSSSTKPMAIVGIVCAGLSLFLAVGRVVLGLGMLAPQLFK